MDIEYVRSFCLSLPYSSEDMPFGEGTLVFRVAGKIFGLMSLDAEINRVNLKCDPEKVEELRENHHFILPGYHMNKKHWNSIILEDGIDSKFLKSLITDSYNLIFNSLPKKLKEELGNSR